MPQEPPIHSLLMKHRRRLLQHHAGDPHAERLISKLGNMMREVGPERRFEPNLTLSQLREKDPEAHAKIEQLISNAIKLLRK